MRNGLSDSEKSAIVSLYELLESRNIPILAGVDKIQIIVCRKLHFELFCVGCHIVQVALENNRLAKAIDAPRKWKTFSVAEPSRSPSFTAPRPCRSSSDGPSSSRDTFPPWRMCRRTFRPCPSLW